MGFWFYMLIIDLIIPITMAGFGRYFVKSPPKKINETFGYRTTMSMKNKDTWDFAHHYCGKIWRCCGLIMVPVSIIVMLPAIGKKLDFVGMVGGILCAVQLVMLVGSILPTEIALRKAFDKDGYRR